MILKKYYQILVKKFLIDELSCSLYFEKIILKNNKVTSSQDPIYYFKSIKNKKKLKILKGSYSRWCSTY